MPRARSRRSSSAPGSRSRSAASISAAFAGSRSVRLRARRAFTASATSCCWAPSWMLRSSLRRSSSCAATSRFCAACRSSRRALSSSVSRTLRSTSPAWAARSRTSFSLVGIHRVVRGHGHRQGARAARPVLDARFGAEVVGPRAGSAVGRPRRDRAELVLDASQTTARSAPTPSPRTRASRGSTSSEEYVPASWPPNVGHHLVGRRALAVDDAVRESPSPRPQRLEDQRHDGRRQGREERAALPADERTDAGDDGDVHERDERDDDREHDRLADHEVDVVQAVPQDRDADRDRDQQERHHGGRAEDVA